MVAVGPISAPRISKQQYTPMAAAEATAWSLQQHQQPQWYDPYGSCGWYTPAGVSGDPYSPPSPATAFAQPPEGDSEPSQQPQHAEAVAAVAATEHAKIRALEAELKTQKAEAEAAAARAEVERVQLEKQIPHVGLDADFRKFSWKSASKPKKRFLEISLEICLAEKYALIVEEIP